MMWRLVQSGFRLISSSRWPLEYTSSDLGSKAGTPLKVMCDQPETGIKWELGKGCVMRSPMLRRSCKGTVPVKVKMKLLEYEAQ
jgi:hypothetical protein